jgi:hypothetical protein
VLVALFESFFFLSLALEGFLGCRLLLLVELVLFDCRFQLQRLGNDLRYCSSVLIFSVKLLRVDGLARSKSHLISLFIQEIFQAVRVLLGYKIASEVMEVIHVNHLSLPVFALVVTKV